jgi:hypothetical protein
MKRLILIVSVTLLLIPTLGLAQQASNNVNVLPLFSDPNDPEFFLKGDGYLQRQVEPTIAASTRNPDHLLAFFNDYRAVDIPDDTGLGELEQLAMLFNTSRLVLAAIPWLQPPQISVPPIAAAEAWVGMSRSYDGGLTWSGGFIPGGPFDDSPASLASPIYGLEAATDPVVVPGPCGTFYVVFVAFTRGGESKIVVARYEDLNNDEGGDPIVYQGMTVLESGNNAEHGYFLDKPHINLDIWRGVGAVDACSHRVYVSYSTFNGLTKDEKVQTKMNFAVSEDGGLTYSTQKINKTFNQNQGSVIAIDPRPGTPKVEGGGTVYVLWRHFFDPDTIVMTKTLDYGAKWSNPEAILGVTPMAEFDQPTISSTAFNDPETLSFRSNGFPTATVTDDGTIFAAWQERVDIDPLSPDFGFPSSDMATDSPRIVLTQSTDAGDSWSNRKAVDFGDRVEPFDPGITPLIGAPPPSPRQSGPQVMPDLAFGGGRLMLAYLESRGLLGSELGTGDEIVQPFDLSLTGYISGYRRVMDIRSALIDPDAGDLLSTSQVSRYPIQIGADLSDGQDLADVAAVNFPCVQDTGDPLDPVCTRQVNRANAPQSGAGTSPFMGDYIDLVPTLQFVPDGAGGWRWATQPGDTPYQGFHSVWADNRHLSPPTYPAADPEYLRYQNYGPPGIGGACFNPGSRNTDVLTSKVDASVIVSAPTTYKQLNARRGFPLSIRNPTDTDRFYRLTITDGADHATFSVDPALAGDVDSGDIQIFKYSGTSQVVYVEPDAPGAIRIEVAEITGFGGSVIPGGQFGAVILNGDPSNPPVEDLDPNEDLEPTIGDAFVINPVPESAFVINQGDPNAFVINPFVDNAFVINQSTDNAFVINAFVINAFVINAFVINQSIYDVVDTTWTVTANSDDTASSYLSQINIDNAEQFLGNYAFQLIIDKNSGYGSYLGDDEACAAFAASSVPQQQVVANVTQNPADVDNAFVINPAPENAFVINPFPENAFVINSTFTMAPEDDAPAPAKYVQPTNDGTLKAPPADNTINITLRAYQLVPDSELPTDPATGKKFKYNPDRSLGGDEPALSIIPTSCTTPECIVSNAPDLVSEGVDTTPITVQAGRTFSFPSWTLRNQGVNDAVAEVRVLRHGFFLSNDQTVVLERFSDEPTGGDQRIFWVPSPTNTVAGGGFQTIADAEIPVPLDVTPGDYFLVLFVDDFREVSEKNEPNNQIAIPITIEEYNDPPVAIDTQVTTDEDTPLAGFLAADDPDGDELTFTLLSFPSHGTVSLDDVTTGAFTYTPDADFNGTDSFTFEASDGQFSSEVATVSITITAVNDPPMAMDDSVTVFQNSGSNVIDVLANDTDIDNVVLLVSSVSPASNGTTAIGEGGAFVTYSPNENFVGGDAFAYQIADGSGGTSTATVTITVFDAVSDWDFVGLLTPWTPGYIANAGSAIPLKWYYADPATGVKVESAVADPEIRIKGPFVCALGEDENTVEIVNDPGSSDLRYSDGDWQFNWDTVDLATGCYNVRVVSQYTSQIDGPFRIELR